MTPDLWMLLAAVALAWLLIAAAATPTFMQDPRWSLGNRDTPRQAEHGWRARLRRTSENMNENLPIFAALVLVAHVSGEADSTTALGSQVFVGARVAHAVLYVVGVTYLRTAGWYASIFGLLLIAWTFV